MKIVIVTSGSRGDVQVRSCAVATLGLTHKPAPCHVMMGLVSRGGEWVRSVCLLALYAMHPCLKSCGLCWHHGCSPM
jgi:hypothetical protein